MLFKSFFTLLLYIYNWLFISFPDLPFWPLPLYLNACLIYLPLFRNQPLLKLRYFSSIPTHCLDLFVLELSHGLFSLPLPPGFDQLPIELRMSLVKFGKLYSYLLYFLRFRRVVCFNKLLDVTNLVPYSYLNFWEILRQVHRGNLFLLLTESCQRGI